MHHYPFHIGDYRSGCINFTQLERWVYRDLMDVCYDTEAPLPLDHTTLFRIVGARTQEHKDAVLNVLADKFEKTNSGYENARVVYEISKYHKKADSARNANQNRWASDKHLKSDADRILTKNQEPRTSVDAAQGSATKRGTRIHQDWKLPKSWGEWTMENLSGWSDEDVRQEAASFHDFWLSKAGKDASKLDWEATWRNWCRNSKRNTGAAKLQDNRDNKFAGAI